MTACRVLGFAEGVGPQTPLMADCACNPDDRPRKMPLFVHNATADAVGRQLRGVLQGGMVLFTYRCSCRRKVVVTLDDMFALGDVEAV